MPLECLHNKNIPKRKTKPPLGGNGICEIIQDSNCPELHKAQTVICPSQLYRILSKYDSKFSFCDTWVNNQFSYKINQSINQSISKANSSGRAAKLWTSPNNFALRNVKLTFFSLFNVQFICRNYCDLPTKIGF